MLTFFPRIKHSADRKGIRQMQQHCRVVSTGKTLSLSPSLSLRVLGFIVRKHSLTFRIAECRARVPDQEAGDIVGYANIPALMGRVWVVAAHADTVAAAVEGPVPDASRVHVLPV